jgi:hypothetical protein
VERRALAAASIERNYIAEPDASDYAFLQVNSDRDKVAASLANRHIAPALTGKATGRHRNEITINRYVAADGERTHSGERSRHDA